MARKVFVDMDGVLADIDYFYRERFGMDLAPFRLSRENPPGFWENVKSCGDFFEALPMMLDAMTLWRGLTALGVQPIVLSGISEKAGEDAPDQKRRWVRRWLGKDVPMVFCKASEKCLFGSAGDVLIDDWTKHQPKWEAMGGIFIVHTSAVDSLAQFGAVLHAQAETRDDLKKLYDFLKVDSLMNAKLSITGLRERITFTKDFEAVKADRQALRAFLRRVVDKLDVILPKVDAIIAFNTVRTGHPVYDGPNLVEELKEAKTLVAVNPVQA